VRTPTTMRVAVMLTGTRQQRLLERDPDSNGSPTKGSPAAARPRKTVFHHRDGDKRRCVDCCCLQQSLLGAASALCRQTKWLRVDRDGGKSCFVATVCTGPLLIARCCAAFRL
jgi:hypothetical protein